MFALYQALILAMGFHEKGRSLMKKKEFENALCHLLQADHHFRCVTAPVVAPSQPDPLGVVAAIGSAHSPECGGCLQQMWLRPARVRGQLCCPAAGHRVVLPSSEGFDLPGRCQEAPPKCRGLFPAVLRAAAAEAAHDQGTNMQQNHPDCTRSHRPPSSSLSCVVRATRAERTSCFCGCTSSRVSCLTLKETTLWPDNNYTKLVLLVSFVLPLN